MADPVRDPYLDVPFPRCRALVSPRALKRQGPLFEDAFTDRHCDRRAKEDGFCWQHSPRQSALRQERGRVERKDGRDVWDRVQAGQRRREDTEMATALLATFSKTFNPALERAASDWIRDHFPAWYARRAK